LDNYSEYAKYDIVPNDAISKNCIMRSINSIINLIKEADYCAQCVEKIKVNIKV